MGSRDSWQRTVVDADIVGQTAEPSRVIVAATTYFDIMVGGNIKRIRVRTGSRVILAVQPKYHVWI